MKKNVLRFEVSGRIRRILLYSVGALLLIAPMAGIVISGWFRPDIVWYFLFAALAIYVVYIPLAAHDFLHHRRMDALFQTISAEDRGELEQELREKAYFSIGEVCFCRKYLYFRKALLLIPYGELTVCRCVKARVVVGGRTQQAGSVRFCTHKENHDYATTMKRSELENCDELMERMVEILRAKNPSIYISH